MKTAVDILVIDTDVYTISQVLVTSFSQNIMPFDFLSFHFKKKCFWFLLLWILLIGCYIS